MTKKELYEKISDVAFNVRKAMSNTVHHAPYIEQMKNVLYNNLDEIEDALKYAAEAEQEIKVLELELADAERSIDELTQKTTQKTKKTGKASDE